MVGPRCVGAVAANVRWPSEIPNSSSDRAQRHAVRPSPIHASHGGCRAHGGHGNCFVHTAPWAPCPPCATFGGLGASTIAEAEGTPKGTKITKGGCGASG